MLLIGSRVSVRHKALQSTDEYEGARGDVLHYDEFKGRYAIELIHPKFSRKRMLLKAQALEFHHALLDNNLSAAKAELQRRPVAFRHCNNFEFPIVAPTSSGPSIGKALVASQSLGEGDLVLTDAPFLVVSNPSGLERWMRRWDCCYEVIKRAQVGSRDLLEAFEAMDPGGEEVVESLVPDAEETVKILWSAAGAAAPSPPEAAKQAEVRRIATLLARWQTNQHELGSEHRRALYWLAPKVAHSCDPNVGWEDPDSSGRVELRCLRPVEAGEVLGVNYLDAAFLSASVGERRDRLRAERKFLCLCRRCLRESAMPGVAAGPHNEVSWFRPQRALGVQEGSLAEHFPASPGDAPSARPGLAPKRLSSSALAAWNSAFYSLTESARCVAQRVTGVHSEHHSLEMLHAVSKVTKKILTQVLQFQIIMQWQRLAMSRVLELVMTWNSCRRKALAWVLGVRWTSCLC